MDELTREELISIILELRERVAYLENENAELRARLGMGGCSGPSAPEWVRPNRAERRSAERAERKKRKQSFGRKLDIPTRQVEHAVEKCPDCGRKLVGGWVAGKRQSIEIPEAPVEIIEHVLIARRCGVCGKVHIPKLTVADGVVGKCRVGPRLMSLIGTLAIAKRMPLRSIQKLLSGLYGLWLSLGEITRILHRLVARPKVSEQLRIKFRRELEDRLIRVAKPYLKDESAPQRVLAERIEKHLNELFTFVEYPGCPSGNNPAERAIRPAVIARKVSGGTRSEEGSRTRTTLVSLFGTWALQGKDLLTACSDMIAQAHTPVPIPAQQLSLRNSELLRGSTRC